MIEFPSVSPGLFSPRVVRRVPAIFLPAVLLTAAAVLALYSLDRGNEHTLYEQAGNHQTDLHTEIIRREVNVVESDLLYLGNQAVLADFLAGRAGSKQELQDEYVLFCRHRGVYDQIRFLDNDGRERIRINSNGGRPAAVPERELQSKADRYYFQETLLLSRGAVFSSPFDLNVEHDQIERPLKPMIRFATPVSDRLGVKRGILVLNYLGAALLGKLDEVSAGFAGSVWLLNREGFFLRGPAPSDEWGFMLGHDRSFATSYPDEWSIHATSGRDQLQTTRGLFTFHRLTLRAGSGPGQAEAADHRFRDAGLIVVTHVPPHILEARAFLLLRRLLLLAGLVLVLVLVLAWYLAYAATLRRDHERHLADSAARLHSLSAQLLTAQEDERRSLSRDLHDELGQVVTSVTLDLQRAAQAGDRDRKDELIGRALHAANCLLDGIHEISTRLRPTLLDDLGLKAAVQSLLSEYEQRTGIVTRAELSFKQAPVPLAVSENVYRILQEALTNVSKHARADEVFVELLVGGGTVALTVRDNGVGLAGAALEGKRLGIPGMRERVELLNGVLVLQAEPGRGTEVRVTIPLPKVESQGVSEDKTCTITDAPGHIRGRCP
jgi:signal transduction histidine kinase